MATIKPIYLSWISETLKSENHCTDSQSLLKSTPLTAITHFGKDMQDLDINKVIPTRESDVTFFIHGLVSSFTRAGNLNTKPNVGLFLIMTSIFWE